MEVLLDSATDSGAALIVATHDPAVASRMQTQWRMMHGTIE
jgi:predicted ABC-type transport system involved in lysophospholipase L1 biosynthesis ATPase subunit